MAASPDAASHGAGGWSRMKWLRLFKHRWMDARDAQRALGPDTLTRLQQRVQASEQRHGGEIRICVEAGLPLSYLWRNAPPRERALAMFAKLRVWDTEANNGVLIYLLMADRAIEIVADRALTRHVAPAHWSDIVRGMGTAFQAARFEDGLSAAVDAVGALLEQHFPRREGEAKLNELPDRPVLG